MRSGGASIKLLIRVRAISLEEGKGGEVYKKALVRYPD
jgi:hypothetical protein